MNCNEKRRFFLIERNFLFKKFKNSRKKLAKMKKESPKGFRYGSSLESGNLHRMNRRYVRYPGALNLQYRGSFMNKIAGNYKKKKRYNQSKKKKYLQSLLKNGKIRNMILFGKIIECIHGTILDIEENISEIQNILKKDASSLDMDDAMTFIKLMQFFKSDEIDFLSKVGELVKIINDKYKNTQNYRINIKNTEILIYKLDHIGRKLMDCMIVEIPQLIFDLHGNGGNLLGSSLINAQENIISNYLRNVQKSVKSLKRILLFLIDNNQNRIDKQKGRKQMKMKNKIEKKIIKIINSSEPGYKQIKELSLYIHKMMRFQSFYVKQINPTVVNKILILLNKDDNMLILTTFCNKAGLSNRLFNDFINMFPKLDEYNKQKCGKRGKMRNFLDEILYIDGPINNFYHIHNNCRISYFSILDALSLALESCEIAITMVKKYRRNLKVNKNKHIVLVSPCPCIISGTTNICNGRVDIVSLVNGLPRANKLPDEIKNELSNEQKQDYSVKRKRLINRVSNLEKSYFKKCQFAINNNIKIKEWKTLKECPFVKCQDNPNGFLRTQKMTDIENNNARVLRRKVGSCVSCDAYKCYINGCEGYYSPPIGSHVVDHYDLTCEQYALLMTDGPEAATLLTLKTISRPCPTKECMIPTQKSGGCNRITCTKCKISWCWLCGFSDKNSRVVYIHLRNKHGGYN
jgi:hypothetical protein